MPNDLAVLNSTVCNSDLGNPNLPKRRTIQLEEHLLMKVQIAAT